MLQRYRVTLQDGGFAGPNERQCFTGKGLRDTLKFSFA